MCTTCKNIFKCAQISANVQNANVQICKCAKTVCAQNAQICSANFFQMQKSQMQIHKSALCTIFCKCKIFVSAQIFSVHENFLMLKNNYEHLKKFIHIIKKNYTFKKNNYYTYIKKNKLYIIKKF